MTTPATVSDDAFREEWLSEVLVGTPSNVELGRRFAHKLLTQWLEIEGISDDLVYCDGSGDGGIDIAYLERSDTDPEADGGASVAGDMWYLVQSKHGKAFQGATTLLEESQKVIDTLDGRRQRLSSLAEGLLERLTNFRRQASERDRIVLVFATELPLDESEKRVLQDARAMGRERLGHLFDVESISIDTIYRRVVEETAKGLDRIRVNLKAALVQSGADLLIGSIPLLELYKFLKAYRDVTQDLDQLYEKNVRSFLGARGKVNKGIQETLRANPERFGVYNNGITRYLMRVLPE